MKEVVAPPGARRTRPVGFPESRAGGLTLETVWVFVALALPLVALLGPRLSTIDLAYQIRAGQIMFHTHRLLSTDLFSYTAAGTPWLNQQWGSQLIFAAVFRLGSWPGLVLMRALLGGAVYAFLFLACRSHGVDAKRAAILTVGGFAVSFGGLILRPQLLGLALFALVLWFLAKRVEHPGWIWSIPLVVVMWANVHGSFFLGPVLVALALIEDLNQRRSARSTAMVLGAAIVAANLNPFGFRVWRYAVGIPSNRVVANSIVEWQPPTVRSPLGAVFFLSVAVVAAWLASRGRRTPWPALATLGIFFFIGLFAVRGIFWWALVAPVVVASQLETGREARQSNPGHPALNWAVILVVVMIGVASLPWWRTAHGEAQLLDHSPVRLTEALDRSALRGRMFNPQIWGSWLELETPGRRVFVDPRIEVFSVGVWRDYDTVSAAGASWESILDRWRVSIVVASWHQQEPLIRALRLAPGWQPVYQDSQGAIFRRLASG